MNWLVMENSGPLPAFGHSQVLIYRPSPLGTNPSLKDLSRAISFVAAKSVHSFERMLRQQHGRTAMSVMSRSPSVQARPGERSLSRRSAIHARRGEFEARALSDECCTLTKSPLWNLDPAVFLCWNLDSAACSEFTDVLKKLNTKTGRRSIE
jgi:hypothetical protein